MTDSDEGELATLPKRCKSEFDNIGAARGIESIVDSIFGRGANAFDDVCFPRIDYMGGANLKGQLEPRGDPIDADDCLGARCARGHGGAKTDGTRSKDGERGAGSHRQRVPYRSRPGHDTAPQWPKQFQRSIFTYLHDIALVRHRVGRKRRLAEEAVAQWRAIGHTQGVRTVGPASAKTQWGEVCA